MVRSGFWNSLSGDVRTYYNSDFSHLMSLLINDGIHQNYGNQFAARPGEGMQVIVAPGESWFNEIWLRNDTDLQIDLDAAPVVAGYKRIDAIAIKIDATTAVREATIEYIAGTAGSDPSAPELVDTDDIHWHLLFHITINSSVSAVTQANITSYIGTETCPFITGILETVDITNLVAQWSAQFTEWMANNEAVYNAWYGELKDDTEEEINTFITTNESAWTTWFNNMMGQLSQDAATHLQSEIDAISFVYVDYTTLYLPNTAASVSGDTITIGTTTHE